MNYREKIRKAIECPQYTKEYIIKVFKEWLEEGLYKDEGEIKNL